MSEQDRQQWIRRVEGMRQSEGKPDWMTESNAAHAAAGGADDLSYKPEDFIYLRKYRADGKAGAQRVRDQPVTSMDQFGKDRQPLRKPRGYVNPLKKAIGDATRGHEDVQREFDQPFEPPQWQDLLPHPSRANLLNPAPPRTGAVREGGERDRGIDEREREAGRVSGGGDSESVEDFVQGGGAGFETLDDSFTESRGSLSEEEQSGLEESDRRTSEWTTEEEGIADLEQRGRDDIDTINREWGEEYRGEDEELPDAAERHLRRNETPAEYKTRLGISKRPGESDKEFRDRMAVRDRGDGTGLANRGLTSADTYVEGERRKRSGAKYQSRLESLLSYLGGDRSPNAQQGASEFVQNYPREYKRILAERRGESRGESDGGIPSQTPEERGNALYEAGEDMLLFIVSEWEKKLERPLSDREKEALAELHNEYFFFNVFTDSEGKTTRTRKSVEDLRYDATRLEDRLYPEGPSDKASNTFLDAIRESLMKRIKRAQDRENPDIAGQAYKDAERQHRRERKEADRDVDRRERFVNGMRRHMGNPKRLEGEIRRWNERNPHNPVSMDDFDPPDGSTIRPGDIVEVTNYSQTDSQAPVGAVVNGPNGLQRYVQRGTGVSRQKVVQDSVTGAFFPDPDVYGTQSAFDAGVSRQDRVNLRASVLQSGNAVMANEQRRLDHARNAAASSIPEIREAGMKEVAKMESDLHWRHVTEQAQLGGLPSRTSPEVATSRGSRTSRKQDIPSRYDVEKLARDLQADAQGDRRHPDYGKSSEYFEGIAEDQIRSDYDARNTPLEGLGGEEMTETSSIEWDQDRRNNYPSAQPQQGAPQGAPQGAAPQGAAPQGAGPQGAGPQGAGPQGAGPFNSMEYGADMERRLGGDIDEFARDSLSKLRPDDQATFEGIPQRLREGIDRLENADFASMSNLDAAYFLRDELEDAYAVTGGSAGSKLGDLTEEAHWLGLIKFTEKLASGTSPITLRGNGADNLVEKIKQAKKDFEYQIRISEVKAGAMPGKPGAAAFMKGV